MNIFMIPRNHEYINRLVGGLTARGVRVVLLKPFHYSSVSNLAKMVWYARRGYGLVHVHWLYIFPHVAVMKIFIRLARSLGIRIVWEVHNILPHRHREIDRTISRRFIESAAGLVLHSAQDLGRIREMLGIDPGKPHVVIPHANFIGSYRNDIGTDAARSRLGIGADEKVLLCFGFIRRNRGYGCLLDALERTDGVSLVIAGRVEDKDVHQDILRRTAGNPRVRLFTGWIPDDDVQLYFNAADAVVLPYTEITTSGVVPLAYSFRKPVITTAVGSMTEIVTERTGRVVPPGDAARLADAVQAMGREECREMGEAAYRFAAEKLGWERNVDILVDFYETVASGKGAAPNGVRG